MHQPPIENVARGRSSAVKVEAGRLAAAPNTLAPEQAASGADAMASWDNEGGSVRPNAAPVPLRVLVVEDDAVIALLYDEVLKGMGYEVCAIVGDETTAVSAALSCKPDLMIVDQRLGAGSGVAAVDEILTTLFIPQVFVSGDPAALRLSRPDAVVLRKPFHEAELGAAIDRALAEDAHPARSPQQQVGENQGNKVSPSAQPSSSSQHV